MVDFFLVLLRCQLKKNVFLYIIVFQDLRVEMEESAFVDMPSKSLLMKSKKSKMKTKKGC